MSTALAVARDAFGHTEEELDWLANDVIDWLEGDAQHLFSIGEHWAPYPTEVCLGRIRAAAGIIAEALEEGERHPECPPLDEAIMAEVWLILDAREDRDVAWKAGRAEREAAAADQAAKEKEDAKRAARRKANQAARTSRQAEAFRRLLDPASGASASERAQAQAHLRRLGVP